MDLGFREKEVLSLLGFLPIFKPLLSNSHTCHSFEVTLTTVINDLLIAHPRGLHFSCWNAAAFEMVIIAFSSLEFCSIDSHCSFSSSWVSILLVQLLSQVQLFATPWTAARQDSLSFTISRSAQTHVR